MNSPVICTEWTSQSHCPFAVASVFANFVAFATWIRLASSWNAFRYFNRNGKSSPNPNHVVAFFERTTRISTSVAHKSCATKPTC